MLGPLHFGELSVNSAQGERASVPWPISRISLYEKSMKIFWVASLLLVRLSLKGAPDKMRIVIENVRNLFSIYIKFIYVFRVDNYLKYNLSP
jgi:hypothetical protein